MWTLLGILTGVTTGSEAVGGNSTFSVRFTDVGKTVFLNREDEERALKGEKE